MVDGGAGRGMRLGGSRGGGMGLQSDMSDAEMARYIRTQGMQLPGPRGGDDMSAMMGGGGPSEYGGFYGMPRGASSFAPFARHPPNEFPVSRDPDAGAGSMWPSSGGVDSLGVGGPVTREMFGSGGRRDRDSDGDGRLLDGTAGACSDRMYPPSRQLVTGQQQQDLGTMKPSDENRVSRESRPRVVRFADVQHEPHVGPSTKMHELREVKVCSVCQLSEQGTVGLSPVTTVFNFSFYALIFFVYILRR